MEHKNFAKRTIDFLNETAVYIEGLKDYIGTSSTHVYTTMFLQHPDLETIQYIKDNGGIIADDTHKFGILFCVPTFWVAETASDFGDNILPGNTKLYVRLVIPNERPIIVHTKVSDQTEVYKHSDIRGGTTHSKQSNIQFPLEFNQ